MTNRCTEASEKAAIYREAARLLENEGAFIHYPCWCIVNAEGGTKEFWESSPGVRRFLTAFSDRITVTDMSDHFIRVAPRAGGWMDRDYNVLALCLMAAMVEAGDA